MNMPLTVPSLSIVLPCYNEQANIAQVVTEISNYFEFSASPLVPFGKVEILVVDDGSRDLTATVAQNARTFVPVYVLCHEENQGYGVALQTGILHAVGTYLLIMDGDGQYCIEDLKGLWMAMCKSGAQVGAGCRVERADHLGRKTNGKLWTLLMNASLRVDLRDLNCGMKLFELAVLREILPLHARGTFVWAEMIAKLRKQEARIEQVPVRHRPRVAGLPSGNNIRVIGQAFKEWLKFLFFFWSLPGVVFLKRRVSQSYAELKKSEALSLCETPDLCETLRFKKMPHNQAPKIDRRSNDGPCLRLQRTGKA
jgi:glycosyltransferase involved in cell wall biosynthesis